MKKQKEEHDWIFLAKRSPSIKERGEENGRERLPTQGKANGPGESMCRKKGKRYYPGHAPQTSTIYFGKMATKIF